MKVLMMGDVVGANGCGTLCRRLPGIRREYGVDVAVVNGENASEGNGILPADARALRDAGADVVTGGNHSLRRREIYSLLEEEDWLLRPANFHPEAPGRGMTLYDGLRFSLCVINLQGTVYMDPLESPFDCADRLLKEVSTPNIVVDFHGEATSEKLALAFYLDGRVSAVVGTHTHIQTADERILPGGTGYLTDLGMCGSFQSILGVKPALAVQRLRTHLPVRFENDPGQVRLSGILLQIDEKTGKTTKIERLNID